ESLRAVDLAILRGGIEKWGNIAKNIVMKADKMLAVDIAVAATKTTSQQKRNDLPKVYLKNNPQCRDIPRIDGTTLSVEQFRDKYMLSSPSPVIITNAMSSWPALSRWQDVSYLKSRAASRLVPVETYAECDATQTYLSSSWEQRVMSVGEFIETHIERGGDGRTTDEGGSDRGYLAQYQLFDQIPSLRADICIPQYCHALTSADTEALSSQFNDDTRTGDDPLISAWLGPAGTVSPLHNDPYSNILAQVVGRKYLRLYDMRDTAKLYPRDGCQCNNSFVDVDDIDEHRFPLFSSAPSWQCVLESGEMLFIPRHWWHYVRSLNVSFSVSFWFGAKLGLIQNHSSGEYESRYF
ncbi:kdm8, partial [Symbiodinium microadriaticum]